MSALVHTSGGARADSCLGSSHALRLVARALTVAPLGMYFVTYFDMVTSNELVMKGQKRKRGARSRDGIES